MPHSTGWVRGEAPLSESGQFQNKLESPAEALAWVSEAGESEIDKLVRINPAFQRNRKPHPSAQAPQQCALCFQRAHMEQELLRGIEAFLTKMLWLALLLPAPPLFFLFGWNIILKIALNISFS